MLNFTFTDLILIMLVALVVFGPSKMPEIGQKLGRGLMEFRKMTSEVTQSFEEERKKIKKDITEETDIIKKELNNEVGKIKNEVQKQYDSLLDDEKEQTKK
ncbi:Sec-independent protein translocase subunit TatA/TatB [Desulfofalx alkaliphila]|uniref:Sec-independent protein translocase subunit TatA/TatB n=1 Tax=Desulfofalx alkaliphila TaxID=105483 RepID=UPI0004E25089